MSVSDICWNITGMMLLCGTQQRHTNSQQWPMPVKNHHKPEGSGGWQWKRIHVPFSCAICWSNSSNIQLHMQLSGGDRSELACATRSTEYTESLPFVESYCLQVTHSTALHLLQ